MTPFPAFPQGGRSIKTFPPWGKMKGGKIYKMKRIIRRWVFTYMVKKI